jgi:probable F420-dependent oxidoreductase
MKFGVRVPNIGPLATLANVVSAAQEAERLGYHALWLSDHLVGPLTVRSRYPFTMSGVYPGNPAAPILEPLAVLAFLAGITTRAKIGINTLILPYRDAIVTAKQVATADVLSDGRVVLGIGAGWMEEEFIALGVPPFAERGRVTDEYIRAFRELWTAENPAFDGVYVRFAAIKTEPRPRRPEGIPIEVGGHSPAALRRAATLGDGWQAWTLGPPTLDRSVTKLHRFAEAADRDPSKLRIQVTQAFRITGSHADREMPLNEGDGFEPIRGSVGEIVDAIGAYARIGVDEVGVFLRGGSPTARSEFYAEFAAEIMSRC